MSTKELCFGKLIQSLKKKQNLDIDDETIKYILDEVDKLKIESADSSEWAKKSFESRKAEKELFLSERKAAVHQKIREIELELEFNAVVNNKKVDALLGLIEGDTGVEGVNRFMLNDMGSTPVSSIKAAGHLADWQSGKFDKDITLAKRSMGNDGVIPDDVLKKISNEAAFIAKELRKSDVYRNQKLNEVGLGRNDLPGWGQTQVHNSIKIGDTKKEVWINDQLNHLDLNKTFGRKSRDEIIDKLSVDYERFKLSGQSKAALSALNENIDLTRVGSGGSNLNKRLGRERSYHYKSPEDAYEYNKKYGTDTSYGAFIKQVESDAFTYAQAYKLGTNPKQNLDKLIAKQRIAVENDPKALKKFEKALTGRENGNDVFSRSFKTMTNMSSDPRENVWSKIARAITTIQAMAKQGFSGISSIQDTALAASLLSSKFDQSVTKSFIGITSHYGKVFVNPKERAAVADILGTSFDYVRGDILGRMDVTSGKPDLKSKALNFYFTANMLKTGTQSIENSMAFNVSAMTGFYSQTPFDSLSDSMKSSMSKFGIGEAEWAVFKKAAVLENKTGKFIVSIESLDDLTDVELNSVIDDLHLNVAAKKIKEEARMKFGVFQAQMMKWASSTPGIREGRQLYKYIGEDTPWGAAIATMRQFKSYVFALTNNFERIIKSNPDNQYNYAAGAKLIIMMMAMYKVKEVITDGFQGKLPKREMTTEDYIQWFAKSGAGAIYGDLLLQDYSSNSKKVSDFVLGPTVQSIDDAARIGYDAITKTYKGEDINWGKSVRFIQNHTPFQNLFFAKKAVDATMLNYVYDVIDPKFRERKEQKEMEEDRYLLQDILPSEQ